jgi:hypothetical protein
MEDPLLTPEEEIEIQKEFFEADLYAQFIKKRLKEFLIKYVPLKHRETVMSILAVDLLQRRHISKALNALFKPLKGFFICPSPTSLRQV